MILRHDLQNQGQSTLCLQMTFNDCHKNNSQLRFTACIQVVETARVLLTRVQGLLPN